MNGPNPKIKMKKVTKIESQRVGDSLRQKKKHSSGSNGLKNKRENGAMDDELRENSSRFNIKDTEESDAGPTLAFQEISEERDDKMRSSKFERKMKRKNNSEANSNFGEPLSQKRSEADPDLSDVSQDVNSDSFVDITGLDSESDYGLSQLQGHHEEWKFSACEDGSSVTSNIKAVEEKSSQDLNRLTKNIGSNDTSLSSESDITEAADMVPYIQKTYMESGSKRSSFPKEGKVRSPVKNIYNANTSHNWLLGQISSTKETKIREPCSDSTSESFIFSLPDSEGSTKITRKEKSKRKNKHQHHSTLDKKSPTNLKNQEMLKTGLSESQEDAISEVIPEAVSSPQVSDEGVGSVTSQEPKKSKAQKKSKKEKKKKKERKKKKEKEKEKEKNCKKEKKMKRKREKEHKKEESEYFITRDDKLKRKVYLEFLHKMGFRENTLERPSIASDDKSCECGLCGESIPLQERGTEKKKNKAPLKEDVSDDHKKKKRKKLGSTSKVTEKELKISSNLDETSINESENELIQANQKQKHALVSVCATKRNNGQESALSEGTTNIVDQKKRKKKRKRECEEDLGLIEKKRKTETNVMADSQDKSVDMLKKDRKKKKTKVVLESSRNSDMDLQDTIFKKPDNLNEKTKMKLENKNKLKAHGNKGKMKSTVESETAHNQIDEEIPLTYNSVDLFEDSQEVPVIKDNKANEIGDKQILKGKRGRKKTRTSQESTVCTEELSSQMEIPIIDFTGESSEQSIVEATPDNEGNSSHGKVDSRNSRANEKFCKPCDSSQDVSSSLSASPWHRLSRDSNGSFTMPTPIEDLNPIISSGKNHKEHSSSQESSRVHRKYNKIDHLLDNSSSEDEANISHTTKRQSYSRGNIQGLSQKLSSSKSTNVSSKSSSDSEGNRLPKHGNLRGLTQKLRPSPQQSDIDRLSKKTSPKKLNQHSEPFEFISLENESDSSGSGENELLGRGNLQGSAHSSKPTNQESCEPSTSNNSYHITSQKRSNCSSVDVGVDEKVLKKSMTRLPSDSCIQQPSGIETSNSRSKALENGKTLKEIVMNRIDDSDSSSSSFDEQDKPDFVPKKHKLTRVCDGKESKSSSKVHKCTRCNQLFDSATQMMQHECKKMFHVRKFSNPEAKWECDLCERKYKQKFHLNHHVRTFHQGKKDYKCDQCDMCFGEKQTLVVHMRTHTGLEPFGCKLCAATYKTRNNLHSHYKTNHFLATKFNCPFCDNKAYFFESDLFEHTSTIHSKRKVKIKR